MSESFDPWVTSGGKPEQPTEQSRSTSGPENHESDAGATVEPVVSSASVAEEQVNIAGTQEEKSENYSVNPVGTLPAALPLPPQATAKSEVPPPSFMADAPHMTAEGMLTQGFGMPSVQQGLPGGVDPVVPVIPPAQGTSSLPGVPPLPGSALPVQDKSGIPTPPPPPQMGGPYNGSPYGAPPYGAVQMTDVRPSQTMAIVSLVLGILGLFTTWIPIIGIIGLIMALIGLGLSAVALFTKRGGKGFAIGGLVTSLLALIIGLVVLIATVIATIQTVNEREGLDNSGLSGIENQGDQGTDGHDSTLPDFEDTLNKPMFDEMKNNPESIKYGARTEEMPEFFDLQENKMDVELLQIAGIPTEEGSWEKPAKHGRWAVARYSEATVRAVNLDATSEVTDPYQVSRLDDTNKYVSVEYEYKNYTDEDDDFAYLHSMLIDSKGKIYYHAFGFNGEYDLLEHDKAKAGETIRGKAYFLVPKDFDGRVLVDLGAMGFLDKTKAPPSSYFFELK